MLEAPPADGAAAPSIHVIRRVKMTESAEIAHCSAWRLVPLLTTSGLWVELLRNCNAAAACEVPMDAAIASAVDSQITKMVR